MVQTIITAAILYIATAVDLLVILLIFFARAKTRKEYRDIYIGQYLGSIILILVSLFLAFVLHYVPEKWILGLLGLIPIYLGIKVAIYDDCKGEVLALHWSDINFVNKDLYVKKTLAKVNNKHVLQPPKTRESQRWIDIDNQTISKLLQWKEEQKLQYEEYGFSVASDKEQPIFSTYHTRLNEMKYMRVSTPNDKLEAFFKRHSDLHKIHVHGFRHTHASLLFESGATLKEVQTRLGHSDIKTTMDIYTHITQSSREKLADKFNRYVNF